MKVRLILVGVAAGLLLPLAAANAGAVLDPGLRQVGAGTDVGRGAAPIAQNLWRSVGDDNDHDKDDHDRKCEKSPSKDRDNDCKCDKDDHNGKCDKDDHDKDHKDK